MTYHPIAKPTEPGWYWLCEGGIRWELVRVTQAGWSYRPTVQPTAGLEMWQINNDGFMNHSMVEPSRGARGDFMSTQWYGPAIKPPATDGPTPGTVR